MRLRYFAGMDLMVVEEGGRAVMEIMDGVTVDNTALLAVVLALAIAGGVILFGGGPGGGGKAVDDKGSAAVGVLPGVM